MTTKREIINNAFNWISEYSSEDLEYIIENDINLSEKLQRENQFELGIAKISKGFFEEELKNLTPKEILNNLKEKRPDLYYVITKDKKSTFWFVKNIKYIKDLILYQ